MGLNPSDTSFTNILAKTERTFISTILPGHYSVAVSVIRLSRHCSFLLRPLQIVINVGLNVETRN